MINFTTKITRDHQIEAVIKFNFFLLISNKKRLPKTELHLILELYVSYLEVFS